MEDGYMDGWCSGQCGGYFFIRPSDSFRKRGAENAETERFAMKFEKKSRQSALFVFDVQSVSWLAFAHTSFFSQHVVI